MTEPNGGAVRAAGHGGAATGRLADRLIAVTERRTGAALCPLAVTGSRWPGRVRPAAGA